VIQTISAIHRPSNFTNKSGHSLAGTSHARTRRVRRKTNATYMWASRASPGRPQLLWDMCSLHWQLQESPSATSISTERVPSILHNITSTSSLSRSTPHQPFSIPISKYILVIPFCTRTISHAALWWIQSEENSKYMCNSDQDPKIPESSFNDREVHSFFFIFRARWKGLEIFKTKWRTWGKIRIKE
jgi:hypothetical protein